MPDTLSALATTTLLLALAACDGAGPGNQQSASNSAALVPLVNTAMAASPAAAPPTAPVALAPAALAAWQKHARDFCRLVDEKFGNPAFPRVDPAKVQELEHGYLSGDFNGDGVPDFILITPGGGCASDAEEMPGRYGTHGGPSVDFVVSGPAGYRVFSDLTAWIGANPIQRRGDRDVLRLECSGTDCGDVATNDWGWTGRKIDIVGQQDAKGRPIKQASSDTIATSDEAVIRATIKTGYGYYNIQSGPSFSNILSPEFSRAWDRAVGKDGALDYDPFCGCQDFEQKTFKHRIVALTISGATAKAEVDVDTGFKPEPGVSPWSRKHLTFVKATGAQGWLLDDIGDGDTRSLKSAMARAKPGSWSM